MIQCKMNHDINVFLLFHQHRFRLLAIVLSVAIHNAVEGELCLIGMEHICT